MSEQNDLRTKIFLDSGDPEETQQAIALLGFLDGQTTNPSLISKNPEIQEELKDIGRLKPETLWRRYKETALKIHELMPEGSISVEVYADKDTTYEIMLAQARAISSWFVGVFVKVPATEVGLRVAKSLSAEGININVTLCFSQEQAAAVHAATKGAKKGRVYVSPFIGRLDDTGFNGIDLIENIARMYKVWGSHVLILGASVRNLEHFYGCVEKGADIITCPLKVIDELKKYQSETFDFSPSGLQRIEYLNLEEKRFEEYNIKHDLTDKGLEKFSTDWKKLISS